MKTSTARDLNAKFPISEKYIGEQEVYGRPDTCGTEQPTVVLNSDDTPSVSSWEIHYWHRPWGQFWLVPCLLSKRLIH